jgi:hypothetical protein
MHPDRACQQLYTETTLTALLPVLHDRSAALLRGAMRLWIVVLLAGLLMPASLRR